MKLERKRFDPRLLAFVALFFAALAPTLSWPQFSGDSEDLLVQTTLEMRHGGPWWVPTLGGVPRTRKPPLPAWISAAAVSPSTVRGLRDPDPAARDAAYRRLAWQVRWPALAAGCAMLLFVGWMAGMIGGPAHALPAVMTCASTLLLLRFVRAATTDVYLALWVTVADACLAAALLRGRRWAGLAGAGVALGLAMMCKGPVALIQTIVPFACFVGLQSKRNRECRGPSSVGVLGESRRSLSVRWPGPIALGVSLMLAVALPWVVITAIRQHGALATWMGELNRKDTKTLSHDPWYGYVAIVPNFLPWIPVYLGGIYISCVSLFRFRRIGLAFLLVFVPILVLSFFHDRKERYLLPLAGPAAILAAHAAVRLKRAWPVRKLDARVAWWTQWLVMLVFAVAFPLVGAFKLRRSDGGPWYSPALAGAAVVAGLGVLVAGFVLQRRHRLGFIAAGAILTLGLNILMLYGWSESGEGRSEMKPVADHILASFPNPTVAYYDAPPPGGEPVTLDLMIYLDRPVPVLRIAPSFPAYAGVSAVVMLRRDGEAEPKFEGWRTLFDLTSEKRERHHWYVLTPDAR